MAHGHAQVYNGGWARANEQGQIGKGRLAKANGEIGKANLARSSFRALICEGAKAGPMARANGQGQVGRGKWARPNEQRQRG